MKNLLNGQKKTNKKILKIKTIFEEINCEK